MKKDNGTHRIRKGILAVFMNLILIIFSLSCIFPMIWMLYSSLKEKRAFNADIVGLPKNPTLINYIRILSNSDYHLGESMFNSVRTTTLSIILIVLFSFIVGYILARVHFKGNRALYVMFLMGMLIPIHSLLVPIYVVFKKCGISDQWYTLLLPYVSFGLPMGIFLVEGYVKTIPVSLEEAAAIDGSSFSNTLWRIILPITKPILVTVAIIQIFSCWNEFSFALVLIKNVSLQTVPLALTQFKGQFASDYPKQMAAMLITMSPIVILYCLLIQPHQFRQSACFGHALPDGIELPFTVVAVDFRNNNRRFNGEILLQIVANQFHTRGFIHNADVRIADLPEVLAALGGVVDGHGEVNLLHVCRNSGEVNENRLVVALPSAGSVVAAVPHRAGWISRVAVKHEVRIVRNLAIRAQQKCRGIQVKVMSAVVAVHVPAQADHDFAQAGVALRQINLLTLLQIHCHDNSSFLSSDVRPSLSSSAPFTGEHHSAFIIHLYFHFFKQFNSHSEKRTMQKTGRRMCLPRENSRPTRRRVVRCCLSSISLPLFPSRCDPSRT